MEIRGMGLGMTWEGMSQIFWKGRLRGEFWAAWWSYSDEHMKSYAGIKLMEMPRQSGELNGYLMGNVNVYFVGNWKDRMSWKFSRHHRSVCLCVCGVVMMEYDVYMMDGVCACYVVVLQEGWGAYNTWLLSWSIGLYGLFNIAHDLTLRPQRTCTLYTFN